MAWASCTAGWWAASLLLLPTLLPAHECDGYEEVWGACPDLKPCHVCSPVDCSFTEWGSWYPSGGCTGLVFRERNIQGINNECGRPCHGAKIESSKTKLPPECMLEKEDCSFSEWGQWSTCNSGIDQSHRTRGIINLPLNGGVPCWGETQETAPCGSGYPPVHCEFSSWQSWTACSASCGEGRHTRRREVITKATHSGEPCMGTTVETQACMASEPCESQDCQVGSWTEWSWCDALINLQRYRSREVTQAAIGTGKQCTQSLRETEGCPPARAVDCKLSEWTAWAICDKTCDGGQTYRSRVLMEPMSHNGACTSSSLREAAACSTNPCVKPPEDCKLGEWGEWSGCSAKCGRGSRSRKREVLKIAEKGGQGCTESLEELVACESVACDFTDCQWSTWYDWSACTVSCGGGSKRRSRVVAAAPRNGGSLCDALAKSEAAPCNTHSCIHACVDGKWGAWLEWSACSATCSASFRSRRRDVAKDPNECGKPLSGLREEYEACIGKPPCVAAVDCQLSDWQEWSYCSGACSGIRERTRFIAVFSEGTGKPCESQALKEVSPCSPGSGKSSGGLCAVPVQDTVLGPWSEWGACSRTCGGGQMTKERQILAFPKNGGATAAASLGVTAPCNMQPCKPIEPCQDCVLGPWGEWGGCTKCNGEQMRHRAIEKMPNDCGAPCDLSIMREISNCSKGCEEELLCAWTLWSEPSGCGTSCGSSTAVRNRALGLSQDAVGYLFKGTDIPGCSGTQVSVETCPNLRPCKDECVPRDGEFTAWSEWAPPTCDGLCERERCVAAMNNECGSPPSGPLLETKHCEASCEKSQQCILTTWSSWSTCEDPDGQSFRTRTIKQMPLNDGAPCEGALHQTLACSRPCDMQPCRLSGWSDWGACARSCGGGWQTRTRRVTDHASCGGEPCGDHLEEMQMCNADLCDTPGIDCILGPWTAWSGCGADRQRYRERRVEGLANGGQSCRGNLQETQTCTDQAVDCQYSEWVEWSTCDKTCGGGQQHRHREIHRWATNGGQACPAELAAVRGCATSPCSADDCQLSEWSDWGSCTVSCGTGQQRRSRALLRSRAPSGLGCQEALAEVVPCAEVPACSMTDCAWGQWSQWSGCSSTCGGGQRRRGRRIAVQPADGGKPCPAEHREQLEPCSTAPCQEDYCKDGKWSEWTSWSPCSSSCGGGTTFRHRKVIVMADSCGEPPSGKDREIIFCNTDVSCAPHVDCKFADWGEWSACSGSCNGVKKRSRRITTHGSGAGSFCQGGLNETAACEQAGGCEVRPAVDCLMGNWTAWSACSRTCGGGRAVRSREILRPPSRGGEACVSPLMEVLECNRDSCQQKPLDCKFGDWEDWAACDKCSGQRKRFRHIMRYPEHGGANCEATAHVEVDACPHKCEGDTTFCTFSTWKEWGPCTAQCGVGRRSRRRYLAVTHDEEAPRPRLPEDGLVAEFEALKQRRQELKAYQAWGPSLAFCCGCLGFVLAFVGKRACSASRGLRLLRVHPLRADYANLRTIE